MKFLTIAITFLILLTACGPQNVTLSNQINKICDERNSKLEKYEIVTPNAKNKYDFTNDANLKGILEIYQSQSRQLQEINSDDENFTKLKKYYKDNARYISGLSQEQEFAKSKEIVENILKLEQENEKLFKDMELACI